MSVLREKLLTGRKTQDICRVDAGHIGNVSDNAENEKREKHN